MPIVTNLRVIRTPFSSSNSGSLATFAAMRRAILAYFIVIASPLRSAFAISPICRPESSRTAPF